MKWKRNMGTFLAKSKDILQCIDMNIACYIITQGEICETRVKCNKQNDTTINLNNKPRHS